MDSAGERIWWIGGLTCSGKSTVARLIAEQMVRHVDDGVRRCGGTLVQVDGHANPHEIARALLAQFQ